MFQGKQAVRFVGLGGLRLLGASVEAGLLTGRVVLVVNAFALGEVDFDNGGLEGLVDLFGVLLFDRRFDSLEVCLDARPDGDVSLTPLFVC